MIRKTVHIVLLVALGLQFNSLPLIWGSYYSFSHDFFASHCENPTSPCCKGKCQVEKLTTSDHSDSQGTPVHQLVQQIQPVTVLAQYEAPDMSGSDLSCSFFELARMLPGVSRGIQHPPRFI